MSDGRIDGKFVIITDLSAGIKDELGLTADDCKSMGSIWDEIVNDAQNSINTANCQSFGVGTLIEIIPSIWQNIVNTVNKALNKTILAEESDTFHDNINLGNSLILKYNETYPDKKSDTLLGTILRYLEKYRYDTEKLKTLKNNPCFSTLAEYLEKYKNDQNFQELAEESDKLDRLSKKYEKCFTKKSNKKSFTKFYKKLPLHNCGDRTDIIGNELKELGIDYKKIEIIDLDNFMKFDSNGNSLGRGEHVFCVIGMDENADTTNPDTWGDNAVIIDAWAGRTFSVKEGLEYYREFLMFDDEHKMYIGTPEDNRQTGLKIRPDIFKKDE